MRALFSDIVKYQRLIVAELDSGDERVNQPSAEVVIRDVSDAEGAQPGLDHLTGESGPFYFCPLDLQHQLLLLFLQGSQTRDQATGPAFFYRVQQVPLALFI